MLKVDQAAIATRTVQHGNDGFELAFPYNNGSVQVYGFYPLMVGWEATMRELKADSEDYGRYLIVCNQREAANLLNPE